VSDLKRSKAFRYPKGHVAMRTCTVSDLIEYISRLPGDMPVLAAWEGQFKGLSMPEIEKCYHCGFEEDAADVIVFDVEYDK
jgi:hypothetical protein